MKKQKRIKRRSLTVTWVEGQDFDLDVRSVDEVHAAGQKIIIVPFGVNDTSFLPPPQSPLAA